MNNLISELRMLYSPQLFRICGMFAFVGSVFALERLWSLAAMNFLLMLYTTRLAYKSDKKWRAANA